MRGMSEERKKPGVGFWAAVGGALLGLYVVSYGPWMWFVVWRLESMASIDGGGFFAPLVWASNDGPEWISGPYNAYLKWWMNLGSL